MKISEKKNYIMDAIPNLRKTYIFNFSVYNKKYIS